MKKMFNKVWNLYKKYKEIINYLIVGGLTTLVSLLSFYLVRKFVFPVDRQLHIQLSNIISWILAVSFAFFANKSFVFESKKKGKSLIYEIISFFGARVATLLIEIFIMFVFTSIFKINDLVAKVIVQFVIVILNYVFSKLFVFRKDGKSSFITKKNIVLILLIVICLAQLYYNLSLIDQNKKLKEEIIDLRKSLEDAASYMLDNSYENIEENALLKDINLDGIDKLMIVAHPDDETYWGGSHLMDDDYLVVCITCGRVEKRVKEFESAMAIVNDKYVMLNYPDLTDGKKDEWKNGIKYSIYKDLESIINYKDWNLIVTHNPDGEYGHAHHKMTSEIVSSLASEKNLYYFGKYYSKNKVDSISQNKISEENYNKKINITNTIYASQAKAYSYFSHMFEYENWISINDWNDNN